MKLQTKILNFKKGWKLIHDPKDVGKSKKWFETGIPSRGSVKAEVPSYVHLYLPDCPGIAWYELEFENALKVSRDEEYVLRFAMAEWRVEVYLNGKFIGDHIGMEDPFEYNVSKAMKSGANRLDVRVSKPYTEDVDGYNFRKIPHRNELPSGLRPGQCHDSYGLVGEVTLSVVPKVRVIDSYLFANTETGNIEAQYTVLNGYKAPVEAVITTECSIKRTGETVNKDEYGVTLASGTSVIKRKVKIDNFLWWDIDDPNLYNVMTSLKTEATAHNTIKHCGFRTFDVHENDGYFYLNGRRIFLKCSHTGNCMPESTRHIARDKDLLRRDFYMAKAVGFNMIRFISGVALEEQLDYCDELGLMLYEEPTAGWQLWDGKDSKAIYQHDLFEMIRRDRSHPCVTIFGFLNETPTVGSHGKVYLYARNSLKEARKLDNTRLFIYSSGRFDGPVSRDEMDPWCGSFANPGHNKWQCVWGEDTEDPNEYYSRREKAGLPTKGVKFNGDIHHYPSDHIPKADEKAMREWGVFPKHAVFVSEVGIGSMFNVLWLRKKYESAGALKETPDVRLVNKMADDFIEDLDRFGFGDEYPYPDDVLRESEILNCRQRTQIFNILRSNPYMCGVSLTGLLDHSSCGEGLFTLMREYKPGMADTLQNGFAPLKWCLFVNDTHAYKGRPFEIEAVLSNEGRLKAGKYPISIKISAADRSTVYCDEFTLNVTAKDLKLMSIPVYKKTITLDVPTGQYEFRAEILSGAAATDGRMKFYVSDPAEAKASFKSVVGVSLPENVVKMLAEKGVTVTGLDGAKAKSVILVGEIPEAEREEAWKKITKLLKRGARVFVASRYSFMNPEKQDYSYYMPLESKPVNGPFDKHRTDWLYHKEYLLKRNHPYFEGLPTGMMDLDYYCYVVSSHCFLYDHGEKLPDEIQSAAFGTGLAWGIVDHNLVKGDGITLATYNVDKGALTICAFDLIENVYANPAADRLLMNILNTEYKKLK